MRDVYKKNYSIAEALSLAAGCYNYNEIKKAKNIYDKILSNVPGNYQALFNSGCIEILFNNFNQAESFFVRAISSDKTKIWAYINLASILLISGQYDKVNNVVANGLKFAAENERPLFFLILAQVHIERKNYSEAISIINQLLFFDPMWDKAYCELGKAYLGIKRFGKALEACNTALIINPKLSRVLFFKAECLKKMNKCNEDNSLTDFDNLVFSKNISNATKYLWGTNNFEKSLMDEILSVVQGYISSFSQEHPWLKKYFSSKYNIAIGANASYNHCKNDFILCNDIFLTGVYFVLDNKEKISLSFSGYEIEISSGQVVLFPSQFLPYVSGVNADGLVMFNVSRV